MATYQKKLKRAKDGCYVRYIGKNASGQSEKFRLGFDLSEAEKREALILELWAYQERHTDPFLALGFHWTRDFLKAAKAIAKGKPPVLPPTPKSKTEPAKYVDALNEVGSEFSPSDLSLYDEGVEQISQAIDSRRQALSFRDNAERTGQTVAEAIAGFRDHMNTGALAPDGSVRAWGNTELTQLNSWENFLAEAFRVKDGAKESLDLLNVDLALLSTSKCQELIDVVRLRPISFLSKKRTAKDKEKQLTRLERTSASGIIKVITKFFDWLDTDDDFAWTEPSKFRKLNKRPVGLTAEEKYLKDQKKKSSTLPDKHIQLLSKYAFPNERVLVLLGLNCAFGPGEIGQLRIPFIVEASSEIIGIRFKTGNETRHKLWHETLEGLQWQMKERSKLKKIDANCRDHVFLTDSGTALWRVTKAGNYSDQVSRRWNRLIDRIQRDHADFPSYSLGKLRKTAATRILQLADAESASLILAHGTLSDDELLKCYVQIPWERLYEAQEKFGEAMAPLLRLDRPAFERQPKTYIGLKKAGQITDLHLQGVKKSEIAETVGVSAMTVYRHLQRAGLT
jgi:hypothetical protein